MSRVSSSSRKWIVLSLTIFIFLLTVLFLELGALNYTGGHWSYPLDDTFIHLAIAKNLAFHGIWGISASEFQSASSSVGYTLILASLIKLFPSQIFLIPFVVNLIAGLLLILAVRRWLEKKNIALLPQLLLFLALLFGTPLPTLVISGMEHTLQCLFAFLFLSAFSEWIPRVISREPNTRMPWQLPVYGFLLTAIRYEGAFMIGMACLILLRYRKLLPSVALGAISITPIVAFGFYSMSKGSYFLPNSVMLKSADAQLSSGNIFHFIGSIFHKILVPGTGLGGVATQGLLLIQLLVGLLFWQQLKTAATWRTMLIVIFGSTLLQLALASTGWFYRYEAWLVCCSIVAIGGLFITYGRDLLLSPSRTKIRAIAAAIALLTIPLLLRTGVVFRKASIACANIYTQQYQMGQFLRQYYDDSVVAANDIGAISYFKKERNLDLVGLASIEVTRSKKENRCSPEFLDSLSKSEHARIAIVYDSWISDSLRRHWVPIATWTIHNNVICGDSVVSFYAIDPGEVQRLRRSLKTYAPSLPNAVDVRYFN
jgi:hypothetical protein